MSTLVLDTVTAKTGWLPEQQQDFVLSAEASDRFTAQLDRPSRQMPALVDLPGRNRRLCGA